MYIWTAKPPEFALILIWIYCLYFLVLWRLGRLFWELVSRLRLRSVEEFGLGMNMSRGIRACFSFESVGILVVPGELV